MSSDVITAGTAAPVALDDGPKPGQLGPTVPHAVRWARIWIWAFPPVFALHEGEEALWIARQGGNHAFGHSEPVLQCVASMAFAGALVLLVSLLAGRATGPGWRTYPLAVLLAGYTLHGVWHLVVGAAEDGYQFGVITALPAVVVFGGFALARVVEAGLLTRRSLLGALALGLPLLPGLLVVEHAYGWVFCRG